MEQANIGKNKIFFWSVVIAILNPFVSGLILGALLCSEPSLRREGRIVLFFSIAWSAIVFLLFLKFKPAMPV